MTFTTMVQCDERYKEINKYRIASLTQEKGVCGSDFEVRSIGAEEILRKEQET